MTYIARMEEEYEQLTERSGKLAVFLRGDGWNKVSQQDRSDMMQQLGCMYEYAEVLKRRLDRAKASQT